MNVEGKDYRKIMEYRRVIREVLSKKIPYVKVGYVKIKYRVTQSGL